MIYVSSIVRFEATFAVARERSLLPGLAGIAKSALISQAAALVDGYLKEIVARDVVLDEEIGSAAIDATATCGEAVGHKAALNMADCISNACAKQGPPLDKGSDVSETDLA